MLLTSRPVISITSQNHDGLPFERQTYTDAAISVYKRERPAFCDDLAVACNQSAPKFFAKGTPVKLITKIAKFASDTLAGCSQTSARNWADDITMQVCNFAACHGLDKLEVSITSILPSIAKQLSFDGEGFHLDTRAQRRYCCYVGPGMEWVRDSEVDVELFRSYFANGKPQPFIKPETRIEQIKCGEILDFNGKRLIHRAPLWQGCRMYLLIDSER